MGLIGCAETSVTNHQSKLHNIQENISLFFLSGGKLLKSRPMYQLYMLRIFMVSLSLWANDQSVSRLGHDGFLPCPSQLVILREMFDAFVK